MTIRRVAVLALALCVPGCNRPASSSSGPQQTATAARLAGAWEGAGNKTIGFVSESGVFRVSWKTRDGAPPAGGPFRLTIRSAISGRPIRVLADHSGAGSGSVDFVDDPRMYELLVDSARVEWSIRVEE